MDTDKVFLPFVSDDLVSRCLVRANSMLRTSRYQLLDERVLPKVYDEVVSSTKTIVGAVGENMKVWKKWIEGEGDDDRDLRRLWGDAVSWCVSEIANKGLNHTVNECLEYIKTGTFGNGDKLEDGVPLFIGEPQKTLCLRICVWMRGEYGEESLTERNVMAHLKPVVVYLSLRVEIKLLMLHGRKFGIPLGKETKQQVDEGEWRKGWIDLCFTEAERVKWIKHNGENEYEWTFGYPKNASLAYFVKRMLDPDDRRIKPKWELWEKLFGIKNLSNSAAQVKTQGWTETIDHFFDRVKEMRSKD